MVRKRTSEEWTTMKVRWITKDELLKHAIGRETDDDILQRVLKMHKTKVDKYHNSPKSKEFEEKLNRSKKRRAG